jgi:ribosomal protein S18 acetylase RimI-like enzyme
MSLLDLNLARRIESCDLRGTAAYAVAQATLYPEIGGGVEFVAGACAAFAGRGSPMTQVVGLGMNGPVSDADFERVEAYYRDRGAAYELKLCPLADVSVLEHVNARRFRLHEFEHAWIRDLAPTDTFAYEECGVEVAEAGPDDGELFARTDGQGFAETDDVSDEFVRLAMPFFRAEATRCLVASVDGEPAGAAVMAIHDGIAFLFGASTRSSFRGRGVQTALLRHRLEEGAKAGCDLALVATLPGSTSARNVERAGFRVAYTRASFIRVW